MMQDSQPIRLHTYLPQDRRRALAQGKDLPDPTTGSALFADISGFTPLTEALRTLFGSRRGAEELTEQLNTVYTTLIATIEQHNGTVIAFAGDGLTCWFDAADGPAPARAVACGLALQKVMDQFTILATLVDSAQQAIDTHLILKIAITTGIARRWTIGDPGYHYVDSLVGPTITRLALAEHLAGKGEVVVDEATMQALGDTLAVSEWRPHRALNTRFGVVAHLEKEIAASPLPELTALDPALIKPWLHQLVYEREVAGQTSFLARFRPCAALFILFQGINYEADEAQTQLDLFIQQIQEVADRYEGTLLHLIIGDRGDYAYLNFGALHTHEDDARRALKAAIDLREAARQFTWLAPLQMGISYGLMWVGAYGGPTRRTFSALGDDVNLAARLMKIAAPDQILVSQAVETAVSPQYDFEHLSSIRIKGKSDLLHLFSLNYTPQQHAIRLQEPTYDLPMVGRQAELRLIDQKLDLVCQGQGQVIGIVAEAGLGKSRLVAEVIDLARQKGFVGYGGACQSDGLHTPYLAWKPIWTAFFDVDMAAPRSVQLGNLTNKVRQLAPNRLAALPLLGNLLNLPIPDNEFTHTLTPETRQRVLHALLEDCLKTAVCEKPILIIIEDLHWIDALAHDLLEELAKSLTRHPVCLLSAYRPPQLERIQAPRLESLPNATKIALGELKEYEAEQLLRLKLHQLYPTRSDDMPPQVVEKLLVRTQGNPFYLEELLNFLRDRNLDPRDPAALEEVDLPDSLHSLILSRIDQLSQQERTTLRVASIVGRLFHARWLTGYYPELGNLPQIKPTLDRLDRLDITPLDTPEPELIYLFKHIVTHEVTYASLPFATRARLHEQLARYLEQLAQSQPMAPLLDTIAHHYSQSHNQAKQQEYFQKAGNAAQAAFANEAALEYFARLSPLLAEPAPKLALYRQQAAVLELTGRWDEAETAERAALALAQEIGDKSAVAYCQLALGKLFRLRGLYSEAQTWLAQARQGFESLNDPSGLAQTQILTGTIWRLQGSFANAHKALEEGLALTQATDEKQAAALAFKELGIVVGLQGDFATSQSLFEQSLALCRQAQDKWGIAAAFSNLGVLAHEQGAYARSQALYEESLTTFREIGNKWGVASVLLHLGHLAIEQEDATAAHRFYSEARQLCQEMDDKHNLFYALSGLAAVAALQADLSRAASLAAAAESLRLRIGGVWETTEERIYKRTVAAAQAGLSEAEFQAAWEAGMA